MTTKRAAKPTEWLTREQIDQITQNVSAADLIDSLRDAKSDTEKATLAFESASARLGITNGTRATEHVRAADFQYMADSLGGVINIDSPLSAATSDSLDSADAGE